MTRRHHLLSPILPFLLLACSAADRAPSPDTPSSSSEALSAGTVQFKALPGSTSSQLATQALSSRGTAGSRGAFLVITSQALAPAVQPFVDHKNAIGIRTELATVESIVATYPGRDAPEKIKRKIADSYNTKRTRYVMLAGDGSQVPVRFRFVRNGALTSPAGASYNVSDLYYSNLFRNHDGYGNSLGEFEDWDLSGNGFFNEETWGGVNANPDAVDGYPDVALGRVPASNATEMTTFVEKVLGYESQPLRTGSHAAFFADEAYPGAVGFSQQIEAGMKNDTSVDKHYVLNHSSSTSLAAPWIAGTPDDIGSQAAIMPWLFYLGHGSSTGWDFSFDPGSLTNANNYPVVIAAACSTGEFAPNLTFPIPLGARLQSAGKGYPGLVAMNYGRVRAEALAPSCAGSAAGTCGLTQAAIGGFAGETANLAADLDGDGLSDLIAWNGDSVYVEIQSSGSAAPAFVFSPTNPWSSSDFHGDTANVVGDVNGDGKADLIAWSGPRYRSSSPREPDSQRRTYGPTSRSKAIPPTSRLT